jgi:hypothetical protein
MRFVMFMFVMSCGVQQPRDAAPLGPVPVSGDYALEWHLDWCDQPCPAYAYTSSKTLHVVGYDDSITPPVNGTIAFDGMTPENIVGSGPPHCLRVLTIPNCDNCEHIDFCPSSRPDMLWGIALIDGAGVLQENWIVLATLRQ